MYKVKKLFPQSIKNLYHLAQAILANVWYGFPARRSYAPSVAGGPSRKLKVIGITGTNGKTTTTQLVTKILEEAGKKVAMASTISFKIAGKEWVNTTKYTTESAFSVQKFLRLAVNSGCEYLVLETSSHSLDQFRVWGVKYRTAVVTNVTREHLDYHGSMDIYRKAKKKLFEIVAKNSGTLVVNLDMENPEEFLDLEGVKKFGYTTKNQESGIRSQEIEIVQAENIELNLNYTKYTIRNTLYTLNIPGMFNVENALAAICVGLGEGIEVQTMKEALEKIKGVAGRLESVENALGAHIIVDYAVTPDSLEKLYELVLKQKDSSKSKIIAVFGSCGERDRGKRPIMGEIVSRSATHVIVTNEDPYGEDPKQIVDEVSAGVKDKIEGENFWKIMDRREAIAKALNLAGKGDIVVITGKGAEETMAIGNERIPWNDKLIILEELAKLK